MIPKSAKYLLLSFLLLLASCNKDEELPPPDISGKLVLNDLVLPVRYGVITDNGLVSIGNCIGSDPHSYFLAISDLPIINNLGASHGSGFHALFYLYSKVPADISDSYDYVFERSSDQKSFFNYGSFSHGSIDGGNITINKNDDDYQMSFDIIINKDISLKGTLSGKFSFVNASN